MSDELYTLEDKDLVRLSLTDQMTFAVLISRYEAKITRYINRLGIHNPDDQADVLQNIFLKLYKNLNNFDSTLSFSSWLYRIAHNEAISWYRRQSVRPEGHLVVDSEEFLHFLVSENDSVELKFDQQIAAAEVARALEKINEKYKEVIILRYFEQKEYDEISDILQIPVGSVGTLLFRGKKQLKNVLKQNNLRI